MTTTPRGSPELAASQAVPETTVNEQIRRTEGGANYYTVADRVTSPPGSCASGAQYIIIATASGAFTGKEGQIAQAVGTNAANGWLYRTLGTLDEGVEAYVQDEDVTYKWSSSAWATAPGGGTASGLDYDTDGTLAANSDGKIATQKATKTYTDTAIAAAVNGLSWKQRVRAATTANGTLATDFENGDTVDGVVLATGDRILLKNQSSGAENGIYVVAASGAPTRATDADSGAELVNATVFVSEGTTNADTIWTCTTNATITVGSTSLTFATISAGSYLPLSGGTLSGPLEVPDDAYDSTDWDGNNEVPTKNAVRDKIEAIVAGGGYTDEQAQDAVGAMVDSTLVYTDATPLLSRAALTGDVTASAGSNSTTIANDVVTLAKIQNATANSKLLGSGASGSGADYVELTLGTNLSMSGTTLNASGSASFRGALVKKAADETTANYTTTTAIPWTAEEYDTDAIHDNSTNNTRLTVPSGVTKIRLVGGVFLGSYNASQWMNIYPTKNGGNLFVGLSLQTSYNDALTGPGASFSTPVIAVTSGDYFECMLQVKSDNSITVNSSTSFFAMEIVA